MRIFLIIFSLAVFSFSAISQKRCGTKVYEAIREEALTALSLRSDEFRIQVVFHIVLPEDHKGIPEAKLWSQIDALNRDFNRRNSDLLYADPQFASRIGTADIQFCLAQKGPDGMSSSGFTEKSTTIENIGQKIFQDGRRRVHYEVLGGTDPWDTGRYLNIWIAEMESFSGRSSFPGEGPSQEDGIVIDPDFFGNFGENRGGFEKGRTLVHEIGHYLGLLHPWGGEGCEEDDGIEDTPLQDGAYFNCPNTTEAVSCGSPDMIQNFMQYGPDDCLLYFSRDQVNHMQGVLMNFRRGLIEPSMDDICGNQGENPNPKIFYDPLRQSVRFLSVNMDQVIEMKILDMSGRIVSFDKFSGNHIPTIDMHYFPNGIYIVTVDHDGQIFTQKIMKYD